MIKRTKIVATIGPATEGEDTLHTLITEGVNVVRLNTKHNDPDWHHNMIKRVRAIARGMNTPVGIMLDLQGPEIRVETYMGSDVIIQKDNAYILTSEKSQRENELHIPFKKVISALSKGNSLTIADGNVGFVIDKVIEKSATLIAQNDFTLGNRKTINIPGLTTPIPSLTKRDRDFIDIIKTEPVDFVALSFVRSASDISKLRKELESIKSTARIIAKIETKLSLDNIESIIEETDAVMIARGDLGIEVPIEELAYWQKLIIRLCREHNKPVIVATQMLMSMVNNPRPSRSEATDIANAVFNGTDAIMLSEETAIGKYPTKAVAAMTKIAMFNETNNDFIDNYEMDTKNATEALVGAAAHMIEEGDKFGLTEVLVFTESGFTARALSAHRLDYTIIAVTDKLHVAHQLTLVYGIQPYYTTLPAGVIQLDNMPLDTLVQAKLISKGDVILAIHGRKWKEPHASSVIGFFKV